MLIISKFPERIAGRTKCPRGPYAARVFETPAVDTQWWFPKSKAH